MKVAAIFPTYNEKENVGPMIEAWLKIDKESPKYNFEILVIDDNSPDGTGEIVKEYQKKYKNVHLLSGPRLGYGKALLKGYQYALEKIKPDIIIPIDVDFQWDPFMTPKMLKKLERGFDVVVPSRGVAGGKDNFNGFRKLTHWVSDTLFGYYWAGVKEVHDHAGSFKAMRVKGIFDQIDLKRLDVVGFVIQMKTIYELSKTGAKFCELPAVYGDRRGGTPTTVGVQSLSWFIKYIFEYLVEATKIRLERSQQFFRFGVVGFVGYVINASSLHLFASVLLWPEWVSWLLATELSVISNFTFNNLWTFKKKQIQGWGKIFNKFLHFNLTSAGALIIMTTTGTLGVKLFGPQYRQILLPFIILFLVVPYNYFMYTRFIWKTKKLKK